MLVQMHQPSCTSYQIVSEQRQAAALLEPKTLTFLAPFVGQSCTAREAADVLEVKLTTLLYQLKRLTQLGFLTYEEMPRSGRPIKHYIAKESAFFVPYSVSPYATPEEWLWREYEQVERIFLSNLLKAIEARLPYVSLDSFGLWVTLNQADVLQVKHGLHPDHSLPDELSDEPLPLLNAWDDGLWLDDGEARALYKEMQDLLRRYRTKEGGKRYFVRMALTPVAS